MASQRAMLSYWNGSAWTNVVMAGTTTTALVGLSIEDILGNPQTGSFRVANESLNPYAGSSSAKGPYSGVFTDFMPVRVIDEETESIIFYGLVYNVSETYEKQYGMVLDLTCKDYMIELRDNTTDGDYGYKVDISAAATSVSVTNFAESNKDIKQKTWNTVLSSRGGIIKSLITKTTDNLTFASDTARFVESVRKFAKDTTYRLGDRNNKSVLAHIASLSAADPHSASGEQLFGYDYYVDPNFQTTATNVKPTAFFNYFKRATRPNAAPATYGLSIQQPSSGGFTATGQLQAMLDFDFERPKSEIYTHATGKFPFTSSAEDGSTSTGTISMNFEVLQIKAQTNLNSFRAGPANVANLPLTAPELAHGVDRWGSGTPTTNDPPEWLQVKLDGSGDYDESSGTLTTIARIQYINKTASETISDGDPAYVIISEVDESINDTAWADGVIWHGKRNTSSNFTIKSRPKVKYGVSKGTKIEMGSDNTPDSIRENIASALIRKSNQIVRGNFKVFEKPRFYVETYAATHNPDGDNVNEITLNIDAYDYGLRAGMVLAKVDANGTQTAYGYVSSVEDTTKKVVVTLNSGTFSGYTGSSNKLRFYVPVRAGDVISVRNDLVNVNGIFLVTKVRYTEQPGVTNTQYDVVGQEDLTVGGGVRRTLAARTADRSNQSMNLPMLHPQAMAMANALISCVFSSTTDGTTVDADGVHWAAVGGGAGTLAVGIDAYTIDSGTTITTMVASGDGNTGQSGTALAAGVDYYIYYPGTGTALKTIRKANYANVVTEDTMLIAQCKAGTTRAEFHLFTSTFVNTPTDGATENSLSTVLVKKGIQAWSSNISFEATGTSGEYNKIKFGQKGSVGSDATVSFSDNSTETIDHSATGTSSLGNSSSVAAGKVTLAAGVNYIYKSVGDSAAETLVITANYADVYQDDRILLCMVLVADSDDGSDSPSIFPFTANEATISAGVIAAGAIVASHIQAATITTKISSDMAGVTMNTAGQIMSGKTSYGSGTGYILEYNSGTPRFDIGSTSAYLRWDGSALSIKGNVTTDTLKLTNDGIVIGSSGNPAAGTTSDSNYLLFGWHTSSTTSALDLPYIALGSHYRTSTQLNDAVTGTPYTMNMYQFLWYHADATRMNNTLQYHNMNRGIVGNLTAIGPGDLTASTHIRLPSTLSTNAGKFLRMQASQGSNTGYPDQPWGTEFADLTIDSAATTSGNVPTSKYGIFRYEVDGGAGTADTLAFLSGQSNATPNASTAGSSFWTMLSESDGGSGSRLIFEPIVDYSGANNLSYIGYHNPLTAVYSYYHHAGLGTLSFPAFSFYDDLNTGFYSSEADHLHSVTGGSARMTWDSAGTKLETYSVGTGTDVVHDSGRLKSKSSSKRYKEDILDLQNIKSEDVYKLRPVSFTWKGNKQEDFGLIAEEVNEVIPKLVHHQDDKPESVAYDKLSVLLLLEITKLKEEIKKLKGER